MRLPIATTTNIVHLEPPRSNQDLSWSAAFYYVRSGRKTTTNNVTQTPEIEVSLLDLMCGCTTFKEVTSVYQELF